MSLPPHKFVRLPCLLLSIVENQTMRVEGGLQRHDVRTRFKQTRPPVLEFKHADRHMISLICVHVVHIVQRKHKKASSREITLCRKTLRTKVTPLKNSYEL
jgi:hypothetical protein